jgi:hypothetical protein
VIAQHFERFLEARDDVVVAAWRLIDGSVLTQGFKKSIGLFGDFVIGEIVTLGQGLHASLQSNGSAFGDTKALSRTLIYAIHWRIIKGRRIVKRVCPGE